MDPRTDAPSLPRNRPILRLGGVSYLNSRPLLWGLEEMADLSLHLDVPARLLDGLRNGRFDVALLPVIDYQRMENLRLIPAGGIGCDGPTLTVRIFSRRPIEQIDTLACDPDSHTSVALARIILAERYGLRPELTALAPDARTKLLIGDKVICEEPVGYPHQLDLGAAWKELTGLPFVFAAWCARGDAELGDLPGRLAAAKRSGLAAIETILARHALPLGWPPDTARRYLTHHLQFDIGPRQIKAIETFFHLAARYQLIDHPRPLLIHPQ